MYIKEKTQLKNNNKGFTLIEALVIMGIMAALTGLLVPQLVKYVTSRREDACKQNREAILNVYEKCVYATASGGAPIIAATDAGFNTLVDGATGSEDDYNALQIPDELKEEIKTHWYCPQGGTFVVGVNTTVSGSPVAYVNCTCDGHNETDDSVVVDLIGWVGFGTEGPDPGFDVPTAPPTPTVTPETTPETTTTPEITPEISNNFWPYANDERWANAGTYEGATVTLLAPSGKFAGKVGNGGTPIYYVLIDKNDTGVFEVPYRNALGPQTAVAKGGNTTGGSNEVEWIVRCSGREFNKETVENIATGVKVSQDGQDVGTYFVMYGDIYTLPDGTRYIYSSFEGQKTPVTLPKDGTTANSTGNWYIMKATDEFDD